MIVIFWNLVIKNDNLITRNDIYSNEAILITAGANRVGTMEFLAMFDRGDKLKIQVSGGVFILTVADVYKIVPTYETFIRTFRSAKKIIILILNKI